MDSGLSYSLTYQGKSHLWFLTTALLTYCSLSDISKQMNNAGHLIQDSQFIVWLEQQTANGTQKDGLGQSLVLGNMTRNSKRVHLSAVKS